MPELLDHPLAPETSQLDQPTEIIPIYQGDLEKTVTNLTTVPPREEWPTAYIPKSLEAEEPATGEHTLVGDPLERTRSEQFRSVTRWVGDFVMRRRGVAEVDFEAPHEDFAAAQGLTSLARVERGDASAFTVAGHKLFTHDLGK